MTLISPACRDALQHWLADPAAVSALKARFMTMHKDIANNASDTSARALLELAGVAL